MIISQTPFRISFFGGGTDYPAWYREHGGSTLSTTIDKYCYISCRYLPPFFEHKHRLVYSKIELFSDLKDVQHPSARAILGHFQPKEGLEIHHDADLPARAGLGSSSSFTVGLLRSLQALQGQMISKFELATQAIHIEQNVIGEPVGSQDQIAAAYGGLNRVDYFQDEHFSVTPIILPRERREELQRHLMLFFTGFQRNSFDISRKKIENMKNKEQELHSMRAMVDEGVNILTNRTHPITDFGKLLHESWKLKRSLANEVSNPIIDQIYESGMKAGAIGGKLLGAGGGGFILFFAKPEQQAAIRKSLSKLVHVNFQMENNGSRIVHYDPNF